MKKTLAIVLAVCMLVAMGASFAFVTPNTDLSALALVLSSVKITDSRAITAAYGAAEVSTAFNENQPIYYTVNVTVRVNTSDTTYINNTQSGAADATTIKVESSTVDLSFANLTGSAFIYSDDGTNKLIRPCSDTGAVLAGPAFADMVTEEVKPESFKMKVSAVQPLLAPTPADKDSQIYCGFIGVTKAAVGTGTITATQNTDRIGALSSFKTSNPVTGYVLSASGTSAVIYDAGVAKYVVIHDDFAIAGLPAAAPAAEGFLVCKAEVIGTGAAQYVTDGDAIIGFYMDNTMAAPATKSSGLFGDDNGTLDTVVYATTANQWVFAASIGVTQKLREAVKQADLDEVMNFFGFQIGLAGLLKEKHFTDKSTAPSIVKTATYNMISAVVIDDDTDPVQTADFSMNIVAVLAASAILAAAALAFVTRKVQE